MKNPSSLWQLGFRPFFLLGSLLAILSMLIWLLFQSGVIISMGSLSPMIWHGHEMLFGFSTAIIAGFVLTASQNWSGIRGVHGVKLQLIVGVWLLARILIFCLPQANFITALVDLSFLPMTGFLLWPYFKDAELKTERVFFLYFAMLMTGNALVHSESLSLTENTAIQGLSLGLHTIVLIILFIGGRVIPFFTESNISKSQPKTYPVIEISSHVSAWVFLLSQFFIRESALSGIIALIAGTMNFIRLIGWQVPRVRRVPIIWVLHVSYLWLVVGFFISGLASFGILPTSIAIHSFTVGGLGTIIYGMITRVSLGHTGRRLQPSIWIVGGYVLLNLTAIIRVFFPLLFPSFYLLAIQTSAILWILTFIIFLWVYAPMLLSPRPDKKVG